MKDTTENLMKLLAVYHELLNRYTALPPEKSLPWIAIRLLCLRYGYQQVMRAMKQHGEEQMAEKGRLELNDMAQAYLRMTQINPPPEELATGLYECIAVIHRVSREPECADNIRNRLMRMRIREDGIKHKPHPTVQ